MLHTFTAMTYNLWGEWELNRRLPALRTFLAQRSPDLLGVQELSPRSRTALDEVLPHHHRVRDDTRPWQFRSNLWWDSRKFRATDHGFSDVKISRRNPDGGLHWVMLESLLDRSAPPLLLTAAHLTSAGHKQEVETHVTPRVEQAEAVAREINRLAGPGAASLLCTDLNDSAIPMWKFYDEGFREPFGYLGRHSPATFPTLPRPDRPQPWDHVQTTAKAIDWLFFNGPLEPKLAEVSDFFLDGVPGSDHKPVSAAFVLG